MKCDTISAEYLTTICWFNNKLIDWSSAGAQYDVAEKKTQLGKYHYGFGDSSIISADGQYAFIYQKLGTKGLLLKNGELLKEINRSYYCASEYEYPAAFVTVLNTTYLIHCPLDYNRLEFENVETGEIITDIPQREPSDFFHSRLLLSPGNIFLMSRGWFWHPLDKVEVFNIADCINNPLLLDRAILSVNTGTEVCAASFIDDQRVLIGSSNEIFDEDDYEKLPPKHIAIWDLISGQINNPVKVEVEFGNLFVINDYLAWDLFGFPKIIEVETGTIVDMNESVLCGKQRSSIVRKEEPLYKICFNNDTKQIAIGYDNEIIILTP